MKNRYTMKQSAVATRRNPQQSQNNFDDFFNRKNSIIKLRMPAVEVKEIYDIDFWNKEFFANNCAITNISNKTGGDSMCLSMTSSTLSNSSSTGSDYSLSVSPSMNPANSFFNSCDFHANNSHMLKTNSSTSSTPRSSLSKSYHSTNPATSILFSGVDNDEEQFTFKDFVSTVITSEDKDMHKMIILDIARLLELRFKQFKKAFSVSTASASSSLFLNGDLDLFTRMAERIFELALDEPNGILGARMQLKLELANDKVYECSEMFPYDPSTMATSEIQVTMCEDVSHTRKFLSKFKMLSRLDKYLACQVDPVNFSIAKSRLY